jgi:hypothetical protein
MARLDGSDIMPWGKYEGRRLDSIPRDYWRWCLDQEWFRSGDEHADLRAYSSSIAYPPEDFDRAVRDFLREPRKHRPPTVDDDGIWDGRDPFANA